MILVIDNYDSFTFNLVQMMGEINPDIQVIRNDELTVEQIRALKPSHVVLSPGPGYPKDAGVCERVIEECKGEFPILGVCLGHQAICEVFGATVTHAKNLMHGKQSEVTINNKSFIFQGLPKSIQVARYHSLVGEYSTIPGELSIISVDQHNEVMAVEHKRYPIVGLQFHPESIMTPMGKTMLENFLSY